MLSGWAVHAIALGCLCTCLQLIMQVVASDASATTRPDLTAVFTSGEKDERGFAINSFRIPGFVAANQTLVVVAEARLYSYADLSPHHLVVKRSTSNGKTWGALQTIVSPTQFAAGTAGVHGDVFYDPTPVFDAARSQLHLVFAYQASRYIDWSTCSRVNNRTGPSTVGDYVGCTERNMSDPMGQQLFSSHTLIADAYTNAGPDWRISESFFPGSAEGSVAELPASAASAREATISEGAVAGLDDRLIYVARLERTETHCEPSAVHCSGVMFSADGVLNWGGELDDGHLLDPRCKSTVAKMTTSTGQEVLVYTGALSDQMGARVNITCLFSEDGKLWGNPMIVLPALDVAGQSQIGGYSAVQPLPGASGYAGVVLEAQLPPKYDLAIVFAKIDAPVFGVSV